MINKLIGIISCLIIVSISSCAQETKTNKDSLLNKNDKMEQPLNEDWKNKLTPEQYHVCREKGTESAFSGKYVEHHEKGVYKCVACGNELFTSDTKFDSHCGWPSFDKAIKGSVKYVQDLSYGMVRTEVLCAKCDGHLGHIFDDGPKETTGQRFCMNSVSIKFVPETK